MNFNETKINCSDISSIMGASNKEISQLQLKTIADLQSRTKPLTQKQSSDLGFLINKRDTLPNLDLSDPCQSTLIDLYCYLHKGKKQSGYIGLKKAMLKGIRFEEEALSMITKCTGQEFCIDKRLLENEFLIGKVDAFVGESAENADKIIDVKCSWDIASFYESIRDELEGKYEYQMHGYMALSGAKSAEVWFVLLNTPEEMLEDEYRKLRHRMHAAFDSPEYLQEKEKVRSFHTYDEIPVNERLAMFKVERDDEKIDNIYKKVTECRKWLINFDNIVLSKVIRQHDIPL